MKIVVNKQNTETNVASWEAGLTNENGVLFATMTGKVDSARPFGTVSLTVHNQTIFQANEDFARDAYTQFTNEFNAMVADITPISTTNEEGEITV